MNLHFSGCPLDVVSVDGPVCLFCHVNLLFSLGIMKLLKTPFANRLNKLCILYLAMSLV